MRFKLLRARYRGPWACTLRIGCYRDYNPPNSVRYGTPSPEPFENGCTSRVDDAAPWHTECVSVYAQYSQGSHEAEFGGKTIDVVVVYLYNFETFEVGGV